MRKLSPVSKFLMRRAGLVVAVGLLLGGIGLYYSVLLYKNLRTDIEELLPTDARSGKDLQELTHRLESIDYLAVLAFTKDKAAGERFVVDLAKKLETLPKDLAASVEYHIAAEMSFFKKRLGLYLELSDLEKVHNYIRDRIQYDKEFYNPTTIFPVSDHLQKPELDFDALRNKYKRTGSYDQFPNGFYATPDGSKRVIQVFMAGKHSNIHKAHQLSDAVKGIVATMDLKSYAPDLEIHYTGGVQSFLEEHQALIADLELSTIVVVLLVTFLMYFFYRDIFGTFSLISSLFLGTFWTFGVSFFLVGYLNANSAFLGSIIIGNGINFGIMVLARYVEERRKHRGLVRSIDAAIRGTFLATVTAALAAGLSYGSLMLTRFRGFQQFGTIGFVGMVLCWISAFTLLPTFVLLIDRVFKPKHKLKGSDIEGKMSEGIARFVNRWPQAICGLAVGATLFSLIFFYRISPRLIETDLSKLRNKTSIERGAGFYDKTLVEVFQYYLTQTVVLTQTREEAVEVAKRLRAKKAEQGPTSDIASVQTFDDFIPDQQPEKIAVLKDIGKLLTPQVIQNMEEDERTMMKDFLSPDAYQTITADNLPELIKRKFTEKDGSFGRLVVVEPPMSTTDDIAWDGKRLVQWIHLLREIADSVRPGTPVAGQLAISADMVESISEDGPKATLFAFCAVVLLVVFLFREWITISRVLASLLVGVIWLAGLVLGLRLKINFLNFIALPITFGIGVDYAVNIFQRYKQEGAGKILQVIRHTGGAVILASLTTVIGYGSLLIAENQAFVSFGTLAVLGEITTLITAVIVLPAYLLTRYQKQAKAGAVSTGRASGDKSGA